MFRLQIQKKSNWVFVGFVVAFLCSVSSFLYLDSQDTLISSMQSDDFIVKAWKNENGIIAWVTMAVKSLFGII